MELTRSESGIGPTVRAYASQVHPVFMLPPLAASWFGAAVAGQFTIITGLFHMMAAFFAVYTAHVTDGYVDFHLRGEDDEHPLSIAGCRIGQFGAGLGFTVCLLALWVLAGPLAALITAPLWLIGVLHAPYLDMTTTGATLGYPTGISLVIVGGYVVQTDGVSMSVLGFAVVFLLLLAGVKTIDDTKDYAYDRSIGKPTVAVRVGPSRARTIAYASMILAAFATLWGAISGLFPPATPLAALVFLSVAGIAWHATHEVATMLLVRGAYLFLAILFVAVWFRPLSAVGLPDITVFGPYTYLLTELVFGSIALGLLIYANALWAAAKTIIALYPIAYVWDWYTLEVGVFEIVERTGYDLFGIPIEEHIFMVVVPALVIGFHETIRTLESREVTSGEPVDGADSDPDGN